MKHTRPDPGRCETQRGRRRRELIAPTRRGVLQVENTLQVQEAAAWAGSAPDGKGSNIDRDAVKRCENRKLATLQRR